MVEEMDNNFLELNKSEKQQISYNFQFYVKNKSGFKEKPENFIQKFELPMVLDGKCIAINLRKACGYKPSPALLKELNNYVEEQGFMQIDEIRLQRIVTRAKEIKCMDGENMDGNEYIDAFEALGGGPGKEGSVRRDVLIEIISSEF